MTTEISLYKVDGISITAKQYGIKNLTRQWGRLWEHFWELGEHFGNQEIFLKNKIAATGELRILHLHSLTHTTDVMYLSMVWRHARVYGHFPYYIQQLLCPEMYLLIKFPVTTKFLLLHFNQMLAACVPASSWKLTVDGWENKEDKNSDFYDELSLQR